MTQSARTSEGSKDDWQTPDEILNRVRDYAPIGLDPCTAQDNPTQARFFFWEKDSGLDTRWARWVSGGDCIWLNPPFSTKKPWHELAIEAASNGCCVFVLGRIAVTTVWYKRLQQACDCNAIWNKRVRFYDPASKTHNQATFDICVFGLNVSRRRFEKAFGQHAMVELPR